MTTEREKIEIIIREISLIDINDSYSREKNLGNIGLMTTRNNMRMYMRMNMVEKLIT